MQLLPVQNLTSDFCSLAPISYQGDEISHLSRSVSEIPIFGYLGGGFGETHLPELTQNLTRSSHGYSIPSLKISCKSVQLFSRNLADKETNKERKKQTNKEIARLQYPTPSTYRGRGNKTSTEARSQANEKHAVCKLYMHHIHIYNTHLRYIYDQFLLLNKISHTARPICSNMHIEQLK